jgi:FlaA1/EpsC-like NDP-sugar epimerase
MKRNRSYPSLFPFLLMGISAVNFVLEATNLKTISRKYLSMNRLYLLAHGLVLIVGIWLAVVAYIMRDVLYCILFVGILSVVYALTAIHLYRSTHRQKEPQAHKQEPKIKLTGLATIQLGEHGITLTIPRRS